MPEYTKHHYVPETYLRSFCILKNGAEKLFAFKRVDINNLIPTSFRYYSPSQVCYIENLYTFRNEDIKRHFGVEDANIVEKDAFQEYENNLGSIINRIKSLATDLGRKYIATSEAMLLIKALLNMKKRNPFHMTNKEEILKVTNQRFKDEILQHKELHEERLLQEGFTLEDLFHNIDRLTERPQYSEDLLRGSLLIEKTNHQDNVVAQIADLLLQKKWYIYETTINDLFITSDNPGFCINEREEMFNLNFIEDFSFVFPLTPYHVLNISKIDNDTVIPPSKEIIFKSADTEFVKVVNRCTLANAYRFVYGNSEKALNKTLNQWKDFFGQDLASGFPEIRDTFNRAA